MGRERDRMRKSPGQLVNRFRFWRSPWEVTPNSQGSTLFFSYNTSHFQRWRLASVKVLLLPPRNRKLHAHTHALPFPLGRGGAPTRDYVKRSAAADTSRNTTPGADGSTPPYEGRMRKWKGNRREEKGGDRRRRRREEEGGTRRSDRKEAS